MLSMTAWKGAWICLVRKTRAEISDEHGGLIKRLAGLLPRISQTHE
jgi:hypothetical protein